MGQDQVLFCPFCRECFEGETKCPEHDLALVPLVRLGPDPLAPVEKVGDAEPLPLYAPGYGRAWVALAAVFNVIATALPLTWGGRPLFVLAAKRPSLWTPSLVAFTLLFVLARRRSPRALRGMRVLVPALGLISLASQLVAIARATPVGQSLSEPIFSALLGPSVWAVLAGAAWTGLAGIKLGAAR